MKIKIVVEDNDRFIEIPVPFKEWEAIYDSLYFGFFDPDFYSSLRINNVIKEVDSFHNKIEWMIHDIVNEGKTYEMRKQKHHPAFKGERGRTIQQKGGFKLLKNRHYITKKPIWRKKNGML